MTLIQCDDRHLIQILDQDRDIDPSEAMLSHLDSCQRCQHRLIELAADGDSWNEATHALRDSDVFQDGQDITRSLAAPTNDGSVVIAIDAELSPDIPVQADRVSLDFLGNPSHPEMLGRIGQFDVERLIGTGGMGIVFKAFDAELHRPVAVKVLAPHLAHSGGARQRFAREAQSAAAVVHENVVPIHHVDSHNELPFLVMQYVAGESLQARVDRDGPLSTQEILQIGVQIARGLAAAHAQGLVHRDVKPGNILLEPGVSRVLISDFGLARAADDASVTRSGIIAGTPHYMSPEQARGESIDARTDLFALGGVLYFMCTGRPPFRADGAMAVLNRICSTPHRPVDEINEQVPTDLADLIDRLLAKRIRDRPASAEDVAEAMSTQLKHSRTARPRYRRQSRANRVLAMTVAAVLMLVGLTGWWILTNQLPAANSSGDQSAEKRPSNPGSNDSPTGTEFRPSTDNGGLRSSVEFTASVDANFEEQLRDLETAIDEFESKHLGGQFLELPSPTDPIATQLDEVSQLMQSLDARPPTDRSEFQIDAPNTHSHEPTNSHEPIIERRPR